VLFSLVNNTHGIFYFSCRTQIVAMEYGEACDTEIEIGIDLRSAGLGVWQA